MIRFPLPYASICSCYYGLIGKNCDIISAHKKSTPILFRNKHILGKNEYPIKQVGLVTPYQSIYTNDMYRLHVHTTFKNYIEKIEIEQVMKRYDDRDGDRDGEEEDDNKYIYHVLIKITKNEKNLLHREYRWKTKRDVHHLFL